MNIFKKLKIYWYHTTCWTDPSKNACLIAEILRHWSAFGGSTPLFVSKTRSFFGGYEKLREINEKRKTRATLFLFELIRVISSNLPKMRRF